MKFVVLEIAIIAFLLLVNGLLAMAEMSLVSARKARLKNLAAAGNRGAAAALELAQSPNQFLATVQIGITLVGIFAGAFGGATISEWLTAHLSASGMGSPYAEALSLGVVVLGISLFSLIFGELVPKRLALASPERIACLLGSPMRRLAAIARPVVRFLGWSTDCALSLLGVRKSSDSAVTNEEVRTLMQEGEQAGVFHQAEPKMVERVLGLDELLITEIMIPRPKAVFINRDDPHELVWHKIVASRHSRFPIYQGNRDRVVGIVSVKAIYAHLAAGLPVQISDLMTEPLFVPSTQTVVQLLETFRQSGKHFAVVVDEFGSTLGVVTLADVLEAIVGDVPQREARARPEIRTRQDGTWLVDGAVEIDELEKALPSLRFPRIPDREFQTLAGFILAHLGRIPSETETFTAHGWIFEIVDMDLPRIDKVLLRPSAGLPNPAPRT